MGDAVGLAAVTRRVILVLGLEDGAQDIKVLLKVAARDLAVADGPGGSHGRRDEREADPAVFLAAVKLWAVQSRGSDPKSPSLKLRRCVSGCGTGLLAEHSGRAIENSVLP